MDTGANISAIADHQALRIPSVSGALVGLTNAREDANYLTKDFGFRLAKLAEEARQLVSLADLLPVAAVDTLKKVIEQADAAHRSINVAYHDKEMPNG